MIFIFIPENVITWDYVCDVYHCLSVCRINSKSSMWTLMRL